MHLSPFLHSLSRLAALLFVACLTLPGAYAQQQSPTEFRVIALQAGMHRIQAEIAAAPFERQRGLMFRKSLGANQGMAFLFDEAAIHCMWMKNTLIPLSVAFLAEDGSIINIANMQPQSEVSHCAKKPARYALEMNLGWFEAHGLKSGSRISGLPKI